MIGLALYVTIVAIVEEWPELLERWLDPRRKD